jgi:hypothetical protein
MKSNVLIADSHGLVRISGSSRDVTDARQIRLMCTRGELIRLRRGTYIDAELWMSLREERRQVLRAHAYAPDLATDSVYSHFSAAALHQIPILGAWPGDVHVIGSRVRGGHTAAGLRRHGSSRLPAPTVIEGLSATSAARTVVDLARVCTFASAVVSADAALAHKLKLPDGFGAASADELADELASVSSGAGSARARRALSFADERSGSAGESLSRVRFLQLGIPIPVLQQRFCDDQGDMFVDFYWPEHSVIGEFDGQGKYFDARMTGGATAESVLWKEKLRQDRLLAFAKRIVRWDWQLALRPERLLARLASAGIRPQL